MEERVMRLFTSNSDMGFCKCLICWLAIFTAFYYVIVKYTPDITGAANQWQGNVIRAQRYFFSKNSPPNVLVGSSEAANLPVQEISSNWANISMSGGSPETGVDIVLRKKRLGMLPDSVWIEINETNLRNIDSDVLDKLSDWYKIPLTREYERPDYLVYCYTVFLKEKIKPKTLKPDDVNRPSKTTLNRVIGEHDKNFNEARYREHLLRMKTKIDELIASGVSIIFFEPPNAPEIYDSNVSTAARRISLEIFPKDQYTWKEFDWADYRTGDGIHLQQQSARRLANQIVNM